MEMAEVDGGSTDLTSLLDAVAQGDTAALDAVVTILYDELRGLARQQRRRWQGNYTLDSTALVHEAYLKLVRQKRLKTASRAHFLALASRAMRHVLTNYAQEQRARKRGGGLDRVSLRDVVQTTAQAGPAGGDAAAALVSLDRALTELETVHGRACRVVECRFFGGLSVEETAVALGVSTRTVKRDAAYAQAWLNRALGGMGEA
jgi:RNA polymerase sigma factor (TIGR02999 family)